MMLYVSADHARFPVKPHEMTGAFITKTGSLHSLVRILVVDDSVPWRLQIGSILQTRQALRVVAEAADGLEAVQKAAELKPDLILLDIGLPTLNGIEAARQIRKSDPQSKIVFVSQESSADVVQGALSLGACGYVLKSHAQGDLLAPVDAIIDGQTLCQMGDCQVSTLNTRMSASGTTNSVKPQFKQTRSFGNTHTIGLSRPLSPGK